ncbi:MAG: hypothetical protein KKG95_08185 [Candidatus Omnitrophica bacterium]|nr:hypothetical protein [Candidatus Omnitrophota bacterium]
MPFAEHLIGTADVTLSTLDEETKEVRLNLGDARGSSGIAANVGYWGLDGFISRPNDPGDSGPEDGACQALYLQDGNNKKVISTRDNRFTEFVAELGEGDRAIVSNCEARFFLKKERSGLTLFTKDLKSGSPTEGEGMMIDLSGKDGTISITGAGCAFTMAEKKITIGVQGGPVLEMDEKSITFTGGYMAVNTKGGHLGAAIAIVPNPASPPPPYPVGIAFGPVPGFSSGTWKVAP